MKEYILRIVSRDTDHPLVEKLVLESGFDARNTTAMCEGLHAFADLIRNRKTPERLVRFIEKNSFLANNELLLKGK